MCKSRPRLSPAQNLAEDISVRDLYEVFKDNVGPVMSCRVARDPRTNKSRGYGFVHFENDADVEKALKLSGLELGGNIIEVQQYLRKTERATAETRFTNIYVKSLPASVDTNDKFVELFSQFGAVSAVGDVQGTHGATRPLSSLLATAAPLCCSPDHQVGVDVRQRDGQVQGLWLHQLREA